MSKLRTVPHCSPDLLATIVPATPEENTCVVLTDPMAHDWVLFLKMVGRNQQCMCMKYDDLMTD